MTATNPAGSVEALTAALVVDTPPPRRSRRFPRSAAERGEGRYVSRRPRPSPASALVFAVEGAGATVDAATGRVLVPRAAFGDAAVTVTATNSGGGAAVSGHGEESAPDRSRRSSSPPRPSPAPAEDRPAADGLDRQLGRLPGAGYAPGVARGRRRDRGRDRHELYPRRRRRRQDAFARVTATNAGGSAEAVTAALSVTYAAPVARGGLPEEIFDLGDGVQTVAAGADFDGENLALRGRRRRRDDRRRVRPRLHPDRRGAAGTVT